MSDKSDRDGVREAIANGLDQDSADMETVLEAIAQTPLNYLELVQESASYIKQLVTTETPENPEEIKQLSREEIIFATQRANFFEKLRMPALNDDQLEYLHMRSSEIWGEYPNEPIGRWVDWCLWTQLERRRNGVPITEVIAGDKTAEDLKEAWIERHQAREERRRLQKVDDYDRYDTVNDVPTSIQQIVMSPFVEDEELVEVELDREECKKEVTENQ